MPVGTPPRTAEQNVAYTASPDELAWRDPGLRYEMILITRGEELVGVCDQQAILLEEGVVAHSSHVLVEPASHQPGGRDQDGSPQ